jgi:hypothetical protein
MSSGVVKLKLKSPVWYLNVFYIRTVHINTMLAGNGNSRIFTVCSVSRHSCRTPCFHCLTVVYSVDIIFVSTGVHGGCECLEQPVTDSLQWEVFQLGVWARR